MRNSVRISGGIRRISASNSLRVTLTVEFCATTRSAGGDSAASAATAKDATTASAHQGLALQLLIKKEPLRCIQVSSKKAKPRAAGLRPCGTTALQTVRFPL